MTLDSCRIHHPIPQRRQSLAGPADGPLQPAVAVAAHLWPAESQHFGDTEPLAVTLEHRRQLGLAPAADLLADPMFVAQITRLIKHPPLQGIREVLLRHPMIAVGMRIQVSLTVTETLLVAVGVAQARRHLGLALLL